MFRLTTLGALDLRDDRGHPIRDVLRQPKRLALLVYLTLESQRAPVSREKLLALFWPESDTEHARNALSQLLHQLRVALGRELFESQGPTAIGLAPGALWCDAVAFDGVVARGELDVAVDLYRGEFCHAFHVSGSPELDQWFDERRRHIRTRAIGAMASLATQLAQRGDRDAAVQAARRALAEQPEDEAEVRSLLSLLASLGNASGALQAYGTYAKRLEAELETTPDLPTQQLAEAIRGQRHGIASAPSLPPVAHAEPALPRGMARPSWRWPSASVLGVGAIMLFVSVALAFRGRDPAAHSASRTVAVFPFTIRGDSALNYLGRGMVDLLSAKLDAGGFHAIDPRSAIAAIVNHSDTAPAAPDAYRGLANRLGAGRYLVGDLVALGAQVHLDAALHDVRTGTVITSANVAGPVDSLLALVDALAARFLSHAAVGRDSSLTQLAAVTTPSLPALVSFLSGEEALRAGRDAQAVSAFRDAAAIDTTFALALYRLATAVTWSGGPSVADPNAAAEAAVRFAGRLTPLARDLLRAYVHYRAVHADEAEQAYLAITAARPDNIEAWYMLGETRFHYNFIRGRPNHDSRVAFERVLSLDPGNPHASIHLARIAALDGRLSEMDSLVAAYLANHGDAQRALEMRALVAFARGGATDGASIIASANEADEVVWVSLLQAAIGVTQNLDVAVEIAPHFRSKVRLPYYRMLGGRALTDVARGRGQLSARAEYAIAGSLHDAAWSLESRAFVAANPWMSIDAVSIVGLRDSIAALRSYPVMAALAQPGDPTYGSAKQAYLVGALSAMMEDTVTASRAVAQLENLGRSHPTLALVNAELARSIRADLARVKGDARGALAELERFQALPIPGTTMGIVRWGTRERFIRAELLYELGRLDEALQVYGSFESQYDLLYMAPAHLRRAEIHERLGNGERAIFHYTRFVTMWREADPGFQPIVMRARAALSRLQGLGVVHKRR